MNKKVIGLLMVLGLTATLAACGGGGTEAPAGSPDVSPTVSPTTSP